MQLPVPSPLVSGVLIDVGSVVPFTACVVAAGAALMTLDHRQRVAAIACGVQIQEVS